MKLSKRKFKAMVDWWTSKLLIDPAWRIFIRMEPDFKENKSQASLDISYGNKEVILTVFTSDEKTEEHYNSNIVHELSHLIVAPIADHAKSKSNSKSDKDLSEYIEEELVQRLEKIFVQFNIPKKEKL